VKQSELGLPIKCGLHTTPRCNVVADLQDYFHRYVDGAEDWAFRGQPGAYGNLVPSLARAFPGARSEAALGAERRLLRQFRESHQRLLTKADEIVRIEHIQEGRDLRCLSVMQHYEVPTRLLDWTTNFWIALYFACSSHLEQDAELWAYRRKLFLSQRETDSSLDAFMNQSAEPPLEPVFLSRSDSLLIEFAPGNSLRMKAQSAHHTASSSVLSDHVHLFAEMYNQMIRQAPLRQNVSLLRRTVIDSACKENVLRYIDEEHQINATTIYPDIIGLSRQLRWDLDTYMRQML
jgi:hypothetical protein